MSQVTRTARRVVVEVDDDRSAIEQCPWIKRYPVRLRRPGRRQRAAKRAVELAVVIAAMPVWGPLYALSALAVKLDSPGGPVHFRQQRTGHNGERVVVHKLRTMVPNAEELKTELAHLNERQWPDFKITDDPRVTRVGRVLRKVSLDELPQLVDVLVGRLALVGPRPWSGTPDQCDSWQSERFDVKPGLTGLWQVASRESSSFVERSRLDIAYVNRQSVLLDLEILVRTVPAVLRGDGAC